MKIAFMADLHVDNHRRMGGPTESGLNRRCRQVLGAVKRGIARALELGCSGLVIAGDVFDTVKPAPQVVAALQAVLDVELEIVIVAGNHDQVSTALGDHALGPLNPLVRVWERPGIAAIGGMEVVCIPFQPGPASEWFPRVLEEVVRQPGAQGQIVALHLGLSTHDTPAYMKTAHDQIPVHVLGDLCARWGLRAAFAGNWHGHRVFRVPDKAHITVPLVQIGALSPTGWDNPGWDDHGALVIWDSGSQQVQVETIPGPRFVKVRSGEKLDRQGVLGPAAERGDSVYVWIVAGSREELEAERSWLDTRKREGLIVDGEVSLDDVEVRVAARTAATVARSAETLETALAGYVEQMPVPEGVDRAEVLAVARKYLG